MEGQTTEVPIQLEMTDAPVMSSGPACNDFFNPEYTNCTNVDAKARCSFRVIIEYLACVPVVGSFFLAVMGIGMYCCDGGQATSRNSCYYFGILFAPSITIFLTAATVMGVGLFFALILGVLMLIAWYKRRQRVVKV